MWNETELLNGDSLLSSEQINGTKKLDMTDQEVSTSSGWLPVAKHLFEKILPAFFF